MRQPALRAARARHPVLALVQKVLARALPCMRRAGRGRRMPEIDDADLAQRVRQVGEW